MPSDPPSSDKHVAPVPATGGSKTIAAVKPVTVQNAPVTRASHSPQFSTPFDTGAGTRRPDPRPLPDHLRRELGRGARRAGGVRDRREPRQEAVRLDASRRASSSTAANPSEQEAAATPPIRSGTRRGHRSRRAGDLSVQGLPSVHWRTTAATLRSSAGCATWRYQPARHVQDDRHRRAADADRAGAVEGRHGRRVRPAGPRRLQPAARPHHRGRARTSRRFRSTSTPTAANGCCTPPTG